MFGGLFERVASGDRESLQAFIATYRAGLGQRVTETLRRTGVPYRSRDMMDDLLQEVCCRADAALVRGRIKAGDAAALAAYLLQMATNVAHEAARRNRRKHRALTAVASGPRSAVREERSIIDMEYVSAVLCRLRRIDREIMHLIVRGVPLREVASLLHTSTAAVRKRLFRLKNRLRLGAP